MMLQHRAEALVALIERKATLGDQIRQLDGFRGQQQAVQEGYDRLAPLVAAWHLFRARGIASVPVPEVGALRSPLAQLRERYAAAPAFILGANRLAPVKTGVSGLADVLERRLLAAWDTYARMRIPSVNNEVLSVLGRIAALKSQVDWVWAELRDLNSRLSTLPKTTDDVDVFERKAAETNRVWHEFDSSHLPPEVLRFLKDAGGEGAELDTLTEPVRQWLHEHSLTAAFRIRSVAT